MDHLRRQVHRSEPSRAGVVILGFMLSIKKLIAHSVDGLEVDLALNIKVNACHPEPKPKTKTKPKPKTKTKTKFKSKL